MENYDYRESVLEDVENWIGEHYTDEEFYNAIDEVGQDDFVQELYDKMWADDSVTGNGSGSYTFNRALAAEYICTNLDLLAEAVEEFGGDMDVLKNGAEACDVTIRCYLLGRSISKVLDELEE